MRWMINGVLLVSFLIVFPSQPSSAQWRWPTESLESLKMGNDGEISPWWSVSGDVLAEDGEAQTYRFMAPGTVLYQQAESVLFTSDRVPPGTGDLLVLRHDNGFWTFYFGEDLRFSQSSRSAEDKIDSDSTLSLEGRLSFAVFDALRQGFVNVRAFLPEHRFLPDDELPVVGFVQKGELTLSRNLTAGEAQFVVPQQWLEPVKLPRRMYVLIDGLLEAEVDFTRPEEMAHRVSPSGDLVLLRMDLDPGPMLVEVEAHRFDGTVESRTIPVRVPEPVVLDTP